MHNYLDYIILIISDAIPDLLLQYLFYYCKFSESLNIKYQIGFDFIVKNILRVWVYIYFFTFFVANDLHYFDTFAWLLTLIKKLKPEMNPGQNIFLHQTVNKRQA